MNTHTKQNSWSVLNLQYMFEVAKALRYNQNVILQWLSSPAPLLYTWIILIMTLLTLSVPNFRQQLLLGKTIICKIERLNIKQHRSRWDGSLSHLIWICAVCKSLLLSPVAVKELNNFSSETAWPISTKFHDWWNGWNGIESLFKWSCSIDCHVHM